MIKLFELRSEKGLSQRQIAQIFNVSQGTYNNWENGNTQPSIEQLISLSRFFEVSVDFLVGNTDDFNTAENFGHVSAEQRKLLTLFDCLTSEKQRAILNLLQVMVK